MRVAPESNSQEVVRGQILRAQGMIWSDPKRIFFRCSSASVLMTAPNRFRLKRPVEKSSRNGWTLSAVGLVSSALLSAASHRLVQPLPARAD